VEPLKEAVDRTKTVTPEHLLVLVYAVRHKHVFQSYSLFVDFSLRITGPRLEGIIEVDKVAVEGVVVAEHLFRHHQNTTLGERLIDAANQTLALQWSDELQRPAQQYRAGIVQRQRLRMLFKVAETQFDAVP